MTGGSCPTCKKKVHHQIDRLSELPEHILRRVLSFLDSKTAVHTSLLSRRWRSIWKGVPALNFISKSFNTSSRFHRFVSGILSYRYAASIEQISLEVDPQSFDEDEIDDSDDDGIDLRVGAPLYRRLFKYAATHGGIQRLRLVDRRYGGDLWNNFARSGSPAAFGVLATLHLEGCKACFPSLRRSPSSHRVDPFADFPNLRDLTLMRCSWTIDGHDEDEDDSNYSTCLRISGIQLRNLKIESLYSVSKVEIFAPNLESFYYTGQLRGPEFVELQHMLCLDRAYVQISGLLDLDIPENRDEYEEDDDDLIPVGVAVRRLKNLFQGLHSARTLELHLDTFKILERIQESDTFRTSPFTRLKTLIVNLECRQETFDMPYLISQYFLGNPSNKEVKSTKLVISPRFKVTGMMH